jgi:hypothetical protein
VSPKAQHDDQLDHDEEGGTSVGFVLAEKLKEIAFNLISESLSEIEAILPPQRLLLWET